MCLQYLESLDPDYFDYIGRTNLPHLDSKDAEERRRAATAIRTAYHHGLESFFALLFATLQAPWCAAGWMTEFGGFYMLVGLGSAAGDPPPPEAMHSLGNSEHGSCPEAEGSSRTASRSGPHRRSRMDVRSKRK